jgi:chromosome partitioning protein
MSFPELIDWNFLQAFFGEHGKLITAIVAALVGLITLAVYVFKYLHAKLVDKGHDDLRKILEKQREELEEARRTVERQRDGVERATAALRGRREELEEKEAAIAERERKLKDVRNAFHGKEHDLWCMHPARKPADYDRRINLFQHGKPIILVANLKGGVGKSTLSANLAAFFHGIGKRVLLIDADYQGSLSNMLLSADGATEASSEINKVLAPGSTVASYRSAARPFRNKLVGSSLVASQYELAALENRLMIEYLLEDDINQDDARYRLARLLQTSEIADTFDVALIDAPPRLTAATINGFCAATHLLVPTVYDMMSAEAVGTFLAGVQVLKRSLNPGIDLLGVIGMLTARQTALSQGAQNAKNAGMAQVSKIWGPNFHFFDRHIPRRSAIADVAGEDIAYLCDPVVKAWFDELGNVISRRLWPVAQVSERPIRTVRQPSTGASMTSLPAAE